VCLLGEDTTTKWLAQVICLISYGVIVANKDGQASVPTDEIIALLNRAITRLVVAKPGHFNKLNSNMVETLDNLRGFVSTFVASQVKALENRLTHKLTRNI
jgi:hypothetical protein